MVVTGLSLDYYCCLSSNMFRDPLQKILDCIPEYACKDIGNVCVSSVSFFSIMTS